MLWKHPNLSKQNQRGRSKKDNFYEKKFGTSSNLGGE